MFFLFFPNENFQNFKTFPLDGRVPTIQWKCFAMGIVLGMSRSDQHFPRLQPPRPPRCHAAWHGFENGTLPYNCWLLNRVRTCYFIYLELDKILHFTTWHRYYQNLFIRNRFLILKLFWILICFKSSSDNLNWLVPTCCRDAYWIVFQNSIMCVKRF